MRKEKRTLKRFLAQILVFALVFQMAVPMNLMAVSAADGDFVIENGVLIKYNGTDTDVVIPDGVTAIGEEAFANCVNVRTIDLNGVNEIGRKAFYQCQSLETVDLKNVTAMESEVFSYCLGLKTLIFPRVESLSGNNPVLDTPVYVHPDFPITIQIYIPKELVNFNLTLLDGSAGVVVDEDNPKYKSVDGRLYSKETDELLWKSYYEIEPEEEEKVEGVTIVTQNYTNEKVLNLYGWGYTNETDEVEIIYDGSVLATAKTDNKFRWGAQVQLPVTEDTPEGTEFVLFAKMGDYSSEEVSVIYYSSDTLSMLPVVTSAACYYGAWRSVNIEKGLSNTITYSNDYPPVLQIKYEIENTDAVEQATCVVDGDKSYTLVKEEGNEWSVQIPLDTDAENLPATIELKCALNTGNDETLMYTPLTFEIPWIIDPSGYIYTKQCRKTE